MYRFAIENMVEDILRENFKACKDSYDYFDFCGCWLLDNANVICNEHDVMVDKRIFDANKKQNKRVNLYQI